MLSKNLYISLGIKQMWLYYFNSDWIGWQGITNNFIRENLVTFLDRLSEWTRYVNVENKYSAYLTQYYIYTVILFLQFLLKQTIRKLNKIFFFLYHKFYKILYFGMVNMFFFFKLFNCSYFSVFCLKSFITHNVTFSDSLSHMSPPVPFSPWNELMD